MSTSITNISKMNQLTVEDTTIDLDLQEFYQQRKINLLVTDDDDVDRERIRRLLRHSPLALNFHIIECSSGEETLARLQQQNVDCLLLDYHLADMTAMELLRSIAQHHTNNIPIIIITGMGDESLAVNVMRYGAYDYLNKRNICASSLNGALESTLKRSILQHKLNESQEKIRYMSLHDELTDLPNRYLLFSHLEQEIARASRQQQQFAVLTLDLNLFKQINDRFGHACGDRVLKTVAERLRNSLRQSDLVARTGGDEFVCILSQIKQSQIITEICQKITHNLSRPIILNQEDIFQPGSAIGIAIYPEHGTDSQTLLSNSDHAMYLAKNGQRHFSLFENHLNTPQQEAINIQHAFPHALKNNELFLVYQPKVNLHTQQITGVEVLVRWKHQDQHISPYQFIPTLERSTQIEQLTQFTIMQALNESRQWAASGLNIPLSINISAKVLDVDSFISWLEQTIKHAQVGAENITLEITETALASCSICAHSAIQKLIQSGFKISIDDFGSGFTSLRFIRDIEISEIKIDQSYITHLKPNSREQSIINSIVELGKSLSINITAEGIEDQNCYQQLLALACNQGQGFYLAQPMRGERLTKWISSTSLFNLPFNGQKPDEQSK